MKKNTLIRGSLYLKVAATFFILLLIIGLISVFIVFNAVNNYYQEANQKLNATIADHIVKEIEPFANGQINTIALEEIFHNTMVLNPSIEIYLLNEQGKILTYFAPNKTIKLKQIDLEPVKNFIRTKGQNFVCAPDPKRPEIEKVFSAAEVRENGIISGYIYVVLAGEDYDTIFELLKGSFFVRVGIASFLLTLVAALLIGLGIVWILTRNLEKIIITVKKFAQGNLNARTSIKSTSEFALLATTFNEMADTLADNIDKMKAVEKLKSELITNISHDLRTPLAVIHGYIETLILKQETIPVEKKNRYMAIIMKNTEKLEKLVSDLFEISKLESLQVQPNYESFFISELISDILSKYQLLAQNKNIQINTTLLPDLKMVYADLSMIDRVIQNLIDNAIKFTNEGGFINISVRNIFENKIEIKISDTGIGISDELSNRIFDRFYTSGKTQSNAGSGLGLAIAKKIMVLHNSDIIVSSELGKGTTFIFWIDTYEKNTTKLT